MARLVGLEVLLLLLLGAPAAAEPRELPSPILDDADLSVHVVATSCNAYLITCKKTGHYVVVDPGNGLDGAIAAQRARGRTLTGVWITHEHGDHLTGLATLRARHPVAVYAHGAARDAIARMRKAFEAGRRTRLGQPIPLPDHAVADGSVVRVGKTSWKVLHLPGHAPGSVGYLLEGRVLVAGDVLFKGSIGRTDLPTSDPDAFAKALGTKVWPLADEVLVLPGHGPHTTLGAEKRTNRLLQDFARRGRGEAPPARPWMGVQLDPQHPGPGLRLLQVVAGSPAALAGLRVGDVLTALDGVALAAPADLGAVMGRHAVGDAVELVYRRGATTKRCTLTFAVPPANR